MHPAFSVIFFTVVSGTGYGLLFLIGMAIAIDPLAIDPIVALLSIAVGSAFAAAGLVSSLLHLGQPQRAWRALSQWRSSWLSREGVAALLCFVPVLALAALLWHHAGALALQSAVPRALTVLRIVAVALAFAAATTVFCTARIYTSLKTIPAWHHRLVLPGYLLLGLLGGVALLWLIDAAAGVESAPALRRNLPGALAALAIACWAIKSAYWRSIDTSAPASTHESATGLGRFGSVRGGEAPHTEENYLTREMGFAVARKHSTRLRALARLAFALLPLALALTALAFGSIPGWISIALAALAAVSIVTGTFVERWLFFAEARHVVMLYYPAARN